MASGATVRVAGTVASITGAGTTLAVTIPSGAVPGDLLMIFIGQAASGAPPGLPTGWNENKLAGGGSSTGSATGLGEISGWKKCISTDPGSTVTVTRRSGVAAAAVIIVVKAADTSQVATTPGATSPLRQAAANVSNTGSASTNATIPALSSGSTLIGAELLLGFTAAANNEGFASNPSGYSKVVSGGTTGIGIAVFSRSVTTVGTAVGSATYSMGITSATSISYLAGITNDTVQPTGSITTPSSLEVVSGAAVTVASADAADNVAVVSVQFQQSAHGANSWSNISPADTTSPYSVSWDTTGVADGSYDLQAVITDDADNTNTTAILTVIVQNNPPNPSQMQAHYL